MLRTVIQQSYTGNLAVDTSGMFNNGIPVKVTAEQPGFAFKQPGSRINVRPSQSLRDLECIRAAVGFSLQPKGGQHRYNLIEGFESFALFVNPDLSLSGTIFDANSNWTGATSPAAVVTAGDTHVAGIECDGINMVRVLLDGKVVAENYDVTGAVREVGYMGLAIGHWPNPPNQYTFEGTIFEVLLQKYDPTAELTQSIDPCCFDRAALMRWYAQVAKKGVSVATLAQAAEALRTATKNAVITTRGGGKAATEAQQALGAALASALRRGDFAAMEFVMKQSQIFAEGRLDQATLATLGQEVQGAIADFGLEWSDWCEFLRLVCLDPCAGEKGCRDGG
jgi:hypothetical protein